MEYSNWTEWLLAAIGAGGLGSVVNQIVKRLTEITGLSAFVVSSVLSIILACGVIYLTGQFDAKNMTVTSMAVFTVSQVIFRFLLSKDRVTPEATPLAD
jgi:uncharacterized membrane protein